MVTALVSQWGTSPAQKLNEPTVYQTARRCMEIMLIKSKIQKGQPNVPRKPKGEIYPLEIILQNGVLLTWDDGWPRGKTHNYIIYTQYN